jgi:nitroreductase
MVFQELVKQRYSVRDFRDAEVEQEKLEMILDAARLAPSAVNFQPFRLYVFNGGTKLDQIKAAYHREWIKKAPIIVLVVGLHEMGWKRAQDRKDYTDVDAAIAIDHMTLQAADLGLGTCWVCNFDVETVRKVLMLKDNEDPVALIPIGYPVVDEAPVKRRKGLDELVKYV